MCKFISNNPVKKLHFNPVKNKKNLISTLHLNISKIGQNLLKKTKKEKRNNYLNHYKHFYK